MAHTAMCMRERLQLQLIASGAGLCDAAVVQHKRLAGVGEVQVERLKQLSPWSAALCGLQNVWHALWFSSDMLCCIRAVQRSSCSS